MSHEIIVRAWKDEAFRNSLGDAIRELLPDNPAGLVQLTDAELGAAAGGWVFTFGWKLSDCTCPLK